MFGRLFRQTRNSAAQVVKTYPYAASTAVFFCGTAVACVSIANMLDIQFEPPPRDPNEKMQLEEARFMAIIEDAKQSNDAEKMSNLREAGRRFMGPGENDDDSPYKMKIEKRAKQIMKRQHAMIDKRQREVQRHETEEKNNEMQRQETTKIWK